MMTIWQLLSLLTFGVVEILILCNLIFAIRFDKQPFGRIHALILAVCTIELLVVFLGVKLP